MGGLWRACRGAACLASVWAEGYAAGQQAVRHEDAARSLFRKALPDVRGSFNPVQMESILKNRIAGLRGGGENDATFPALHLLQDMHAAVPDSLDIRLDRLSLDARRCGLSGTAASYEQVNALARGPVRDSPASARPKSSVQPAVPASPNRHAVGRGHL